MPLTRRQFDLGINDEIEALMRAIYQRLESQKDAAFGELELADDFGRTPDDEYLSIAIKVLQRVYAIEKRVIENQAYYAVLREVETETWTPKVPV